MLAKFIDIYPMLNDKSMMGATFEVDNPNMVQVFEDDPSTVFSMDKVLDDFCTKIIEVKGYEVVRSFTYFNQDNNTLTFEVKEKELFFIAVYVIGGIPENISTGNDLNRLIEKMNKEDFNSAQDSFKIFNSKNEVVYFREV